MDMAHVEGKAEAVRDGAEKAILWRVPPSAHACVRNVGSVNRTSAECPAFRRSAQGAGLQ